MRIQAGQTTVVFKNIRKEKLFTRNDCPSGSQGSEFLYAVAIGVYESTISQAAADKLAEDDVNANGQAAANEFGTCTKENI